MMNINHPGKKGNRKVILHKLKGTHKGPTGQHEQHDHGLEHQGPGCGKACL